MRRLWAYIIVVFAAVVAVIASFPGVAKGVAGTAGGEFQTRRVFTFQLSQRDKTDDDINPKELNENSSKEIADIMKTRLDKYNVSSYDLKTVGNDMITVSFAAENDNKYQQIITYLGFSGSFALLNKHDNVVEGKDFLNGAAYTKSYSVNEYPTVIIPVKTSEESYKNLIAGCKEETEEVDSGETDDDGNPTTKTVGRIYVIYNYQPGETYQILSDSNKLQEKTLFTIDFEPDDTEAGLYFDDNKNSFSRVCGFQDSNQNGYADPNEVREAYAQADYLLNLFSASALDYDVKCIKGLAEGTKEYLPAKVEQVTNIEGKLVWNRTLTAVVALMIIVCLLLVFFYKLGAASVFVTTLVTAFLTILIMVKTGLEYNSLGVVGIVAVVVVSLVSGIIYLNKLKEDSYRGHTLKKANTEASKKSLLPIIDIHVVAVIIGIFCYVFGGTPLRSFSALLTIGSLLSVIFNTIGFKALMWMPTNATALNNRYDVFGINPAFVPNHMMEEKQNYYGQYADKNFERRKKPVGIVACGAFLLALVGMITFSAIRGGELLKQPVSKSLGNEIYVQDKILVTNDEESPLNDGTLDTILENVLIKQKADVAIDETNKETYYTLKDCVSEKILFSEEETKVEEDESSYNYLTTYFRLTLSKGLTGNEIAQVKGHPTSEETTLNDVLDDYFNTTSTFTSSIDSSIKLKAVETVVNPASPRWEKIVLGTSIALLVITVYLMLRYRLSRGLASLFLPVVSSVITVGLMLLANLFLTIPASVIIAVPVISLFSYLFVIQLYNRERELILDDKVKDNSKEHRTELIRRALGLAYTPILASSVIGIYTLINFFGFAPSVMSGGYALMFIGTLIALGLFSVLLVPLCNFLFGLFSKVKINRAPKENKKNKNKPVKKSAEPEEAIFIGIND